MERERIKRVMERNKRVLYRKVTQRKSYLCINEVKERTFKGLIQKN